MSKFLRTAIDVRARVGKYYVDNLDEGEQYVRVIVKDEKGDIWGCRTWYQPVILAWHTWDDGRELYTPLEVVKNPNRKRYTFFEILGILFAFPFVALFLLFWVVSCFLLYVGTYIRTADSTRAIQSVREFVDSGDIKFT